MAGLADYYAQAVLDFATGRAPFPSIPTATVGNRFLGLFTTAPANDAGTGGTEVTGGSYARVQVAGSSTASTAITGGTTTTITIATGQTWIVPGMNVYDITAGKQIGTVQSYVSGTGVVTLTAAASNSGSGSTDVIQFSAWPASSASSGSEPATSPANVTNSGAVITFAQATANWGTVVAWAIFDAVTSGNMFEWDWLGNYKWQAFTCSNASPGVLTVDLSADAYANGTSVVISQKYASTLPTGFGGLSAIQTTAGLATNTFNIGVNTSTTGAGLIRQVLQQSIPQNVTASFATSTFTLTAA